MKKFITITVLIIFIFSLISCGYNDVSLGEIVGETTEKEEQYETDAQAQQSMPTGIYISEVSSNNSSWNKISDGTYPDWVEIYNGSGATINLGSYTLSDSESKPDKFTFPNVSLKNGEFFVVYCTGIENKENKEEVQAGFKISSSGETIVLSQNTNPVSIVNVPALPKDVSYGITENGTYKYFALPSLGAVNSGISADEPVFEGNLIEGSLIINEYMNKNLYSIIDEDGDRFPWVELYNKGSEALNLSDYTLSDNAENADKYKLPEVSIAPGEYIIVFLSGKNKVTANGEIHASFKLGSNDTILLLGIRGKRTDGVELERLDYGNVSIGRNKDSSSEWLYYASPTPGKTNDTKGFNRIDVSEEVYLPDVSINE